MRCVDVNVLGYANVLVYAHRQDLPEHPNCRPLLEHWCNDEEPLGCPILCSAALVG